MTTGDEQAAEQWYLRKSALMESMLGPEHDIVMHAVIPFALGGGLDLYYFHPVMRSGTAIATKELCEHPREGSKSEAYDCYELVMFTRAPLDLEAANDQSTAFGRAHVQINAILNSIARYSEHATLNPHETLEFPAAADRPPGPYLIFAEYGRKSDPVAGTFGLLAIVEIFQSEMEFARRQGGARLIDLLKNARHYPYSDLDRDPVA